MEGRTTMIRPAPWPLYDTEKVARWLEKMARQGFVLTEHGFPGTLPSPGDFSEDKPAKSTLLSRWHGEQRLCPGAGNDRLE